MLHPCFRRLCGLYASRLVRWTGYDSDGITLPQKQSVSHDDPRKVAPTSNISDTSSDEAEGPEEAVNTSVSINL